MNAPTGAVMLIDLSGLVVPLGLALMWVATGVESVPVGWLVVTQRKRYYTSVIGAMLMSLCLLLDLAYFGWHATVLAVRQETLWGTAGVGQYFAAMVILGAAAPLLLLIALGCIHHWSANFAKRMPHSDGWLWTTDARARTVDPQPGFLIRWRDEHGRMHMEYSHVRGLSDKIILWRESLRSRAGGFSRFQVVQ